MLEDRNGGAEGGMKMRGRGGERESRGKGEKEKKGEEGRKEDTVNYFSLDIGRRLGFALWKRNRCYGSYPKRVRRINGCSKPSSVSH